MVVMVTSKISVRGEEISPLMNVDNAQRRVRWQGCDSSECRYPVGMDAMSTSK